MKDFEAIFGIRRKAMELERERVLALFHTLAAHMDAKGEDEHDASWAKAAQLVRLVCIEARVGD